MEANLEKTMHELIRSIKDLSMEVEQLRGKFNLEEKKQYTNIEMMRLFGVTSATIKKWRDKGFLGYSQVGSTFIYSSQDILDFLNKTHYDADSGCSAEDCRRGLHW